MRKHILTTFLVTTALAVIAVMVGCGGGSQSTVPSPKPAASCPKQLTAKTPKNVRRHCEGWAKKSVGQPHVGYKVVHRAGVGLETMQDTVTTSTITSPFDAVAGYVGGSWPTWGPLTHQYPGLASRNRVVSIAVFSNGRAKCGDFEPGDMTASQAAGWFWLSRLVVQKPCLYSSTSNMWSVQGNLENHGIHRNQWIKWCAHYTYVPHLEGDCDGVQYTDTCHGKNLDCSLVLSSFFEGSKPAPPPGPSQALIKKHRTNMQNNRHAFVNKGCGRRPLDGYCPHFRRVVTAEEQWLEQPLPKGPHNMHPVCWGQAFNPKIVYAVCAVIRPTYSAWLRAAKSSAGAYWGNHCNKDPRRGMCPTWAQRTQYFNGHAARAWRLSQSSRTWATI